MNQKVIVLVLIVRFFNGVLGSAKALIEYQIHSHNDLREWNQLLLKGGRLFKVDPHWITGQSMTAFYMNHDQPIPALSTYSTTDEMIDYLKSDEFVVLSKNESVTVALCFKSAPLLCKTGSAEFQSWLSAVDYFWERATTELSELNRNIEFILDGDGKPFDCLIGRWLPWNSVWINTDLKSQAAFSSNSIENDNYRFQVLNDPESMSNWTWMVENNYGKFSDGSYAYQLWEPDAQETILGYIALYSSGTPHSSGFRFAINIDISMFRIYSVADSISYPNVVPIEGSDANNFIIDSGSQPQLVALSNELYALVNIQSNLLYLSIFYENGESIITTQLPSDVIDYLLPDANSNIVAISLTSRYISELSCYRLMYGLQSGKFFTIDVEVISECSDCEISFTIYNEQYGKLFPKDSDESRVIYDLIMIDCPTSYSADTSCIQVMYKKQHYDSINLLSIDSLSIAESNDDSDVDVQIFADTINAELPSLSTAVDCARFVQIPGYTKLFKSSIHKNPKNKQAASALSSDSTVLLFISSNNIIMMSELYQSNWINIQVGKQFSVKRADSFNDDSGVLMLVTDGGYCYNSDGHNTRSYPNVCNSIPSSTTYVLDYSLGLVSDWINLLEESYPDSNVSITTGNDLYKVNVCNQRILHGSYDQGSSPSLAFTSNQLEDGSSSFYFMEVHQGMPVGSSDTGSCGIPIQRNGLVLDSFSISSWINNLVNLII